VSDSNQIGDIQKEKLPGPEALKNSGKKDGQVFLFSSLISLQLTTVGDHGAKWRGSRGAYVVS
jgi:hypothetical protein